MRYYKSLNGEIVTSINTVNTDGDGNITQAEYEELLTMIRQMPSGKVIRDNGDGTYDYEDAPPIPDPEPTDEDYSEAGRILMGVEP